MAVLEKPDRHGLDLAVLIEYWVWPHGKDVVFDAALQRDVRILVNELAQRFFDKTHVLLRPPRNIGRFLFLSLGLLLVHETIIGFAVANDGLELRVLVRVRLLQDACRTRSVWHHDLLVGEMLEQALL